jgi:hypothetical protein
MQPERWELSRRTTGGLAAPIVRLIRRRPIRCFSGGSLTARSQVKIAQIAPLYESVPPRLYGGTERIVAYLTDALVELGH